MIYYNWNFIVFETNLFMNSFFFVPFIRSSVVSLALLYWIHWLQL